MEENIFYLPGDLVTIRQNLSNKPTMIVVGKVSSIFKDKEGKGTLKGIKCRWFTSNNELQEAIFNTKDLIKL